MGDWIVVGRGADARRAVVVQLYHPDGTPPYEVNWLDTGAQVLLFPGGDAHLVPAEEEARRITDAFHVDPRERSETDGWDAVIERPAGRANRWDPPETRIPSTTRRPSAGS
ncbi:DUF1918 domain-containing protein [Actinosynnema sp. NPDC049800]